MPAQVRGVSETIRGIRAGGRRAEKALAAGLFEEGEGIMRISKGEVPVDLGTLRSTGHVQPPLRRLGTILVVMAYGGAAAPYAPIVHEDLEAHHEPPTKARYLIDPALDARVGMADRLGRRLREEVG